MSSETRGGHGYRGRGGFHRGMRRPEEVKRKEEDHKGDLEQLEEELSGRGLPNGDPRDVAAVSNGTKGLKRVITPEVMYALFSEYLNLRKLFLDYVPQRIPGKTFWQNFFLWRNEIERNWKSILDDPRAEHMSLDPDFSDLDRNTGEDDPASKNQAYGLCYSGDSGGRAFTQSDRRDLLEKINEACNRSFVFDSCPVDADHLVGVSATDFNVRSTSANCCTAGGEVIITPQNDKSPKEKVIERIIDLRNMHSAVLLGARPNDDGNFLVVPHNDKERLLVARKLPRLQSFGQTKEEAFPLLSEKDYFRACSEEKLDVMRGVEGTKEVVIDEKQREQSTTNEVKNFSGLVKREVEERKRSRKARSNEAVTEKDLKEIHSVTMGALKAFWSGIPVLTKQQQESFYFNVSRLEKQKAYLENECDDLKGEEKQICEGMLEAVKTALEKASKISFRKDTEQ